MHKLLLFLSSSIIINTIYVSSVFAVQPGLTISPIRSETEIAPGTQVKRQIKLANKTDRSIEIQLYSEEFGVINQQYDYKFNEKSDVAKWISFTNKNINLEQGESKQVDYYINVPISAEPGGRYISIIAATDTPSSDTNIKSQQRVASLVYINISGKVSRQGELISIASPFLISGGDKWSASIQNKGSTHFRSKYSLTVRDLLGLFPSKKNDKNALILPNTIRLVSGEIPNPALPGLYLLTYNVGLGDSPAKQEIKLAFYSPFWFTLVFSTIVSFVVTHKLVMKRKYRRKTN